jgi:hypothetical protein
MANKIQLHIPEPCHESWENMSPVEKGRFCGSCQKQVVDFSVMSDGEIAQFFKQPLKNSVCGHFANDQLNRDINVPKKRLPWIKYFFQVAIPALLISTKVKGQRTMGEPIATPTCTPNDLRLRGDVAVVPTPTEFIIRVIDEMGQPVPFAAIKMKSTGKQIRTDAEGVSKIKLNDVSRMKDEVFTVTAKEHLATVASVTAADWRRGSINITLQNTDRIINVTSGMIVPVKRIQQVPIIDTILNLFTGSKISPNPIYQGDTFNVEWKSKDEKKIYVSVCDPENKVLLFIPYDVVKGNNILPVNTDQKWMPGNYTVKLMDMLGKQLLSEKLTIRVKQEVQVVQPTETKEPVIPAVEPPVKKKTPEPPVVPGTGKIMPNPIKQGQTFIVEWNATASDKLSLRITAIDGKQLMTMPVTIAKGINRIPVNTDSYWTPGIYVVVLYNEKGKLLLSEKILIE